MQKNYGEKTQNRGELAEIKTSAWEIVGRYQEQLEHLNGSIREDMALLKERLNLYGKT